MKKDKNTQNLDNSIDEILYDITKSDVKKRDKIDEIRKNVSTINNNFSTVTKTPNLVEFLTQNAFNDNATTKLKNSAKGTVINKKTKESIDKLVEQNNISLFLTEEKDRIERYNDYRIIDSYIPQVSRCMDLYRDCILSPDDITKKSINIDYSEENVSDDDYSKIQGNIKKIKDDFKLDKKSKTWIRDSLVLGDCFVSVLKIDEEINKMMLSENHESNNLLSNKNANLLTESEIFDYTKEELSLLENVFFEESQKDIKEKNSNTSFSSMKADIVNRINSNIIYVDDPTKDLDSSKNVGEINKNFKEVKFNGAIVKALNPERTVKLNIDDLCLGYLSIEKYDMDSETGAEGFGLSTSEMMSGCSNNTSDYFNSRYDTGTNTTIKNKLLTDIFVKGISKKLDKKIIEKNQQFKEVIYQLIKKDYLLDKKVKIVYYTPEQVIHHAQDSDDVYGMSKLAKIIFFAKIFLATMLTETMQKISRGRDKRVVYVETGLDEDIEGSIQSVVRDMKAKDINADDLKTITNILKQVGAFEDYFIPKIDGEVPIDFETISGMDVNVDDDFLQYLLKSIISGIGVPATYTDASNEVDFSRSLVMQNTTFVREIVSKQGDLQEFLSQVVRKIYEYEFGLDSISGFDIEKLQVSFPTPEFLNVSNINEQIGNHTSTIEFIVGTYFDSNASDEKQNKIQHNFKKEITKSLVTSIDWSKCDEILENCMKTITRDELEEKDNASEESDMSGDDMDMDMDNGF